MSAAPWLGGQRVTAERLAEMQNKFSNWTPAWSTSTGASLPSYGNATIDCRYAVSGDLVTAYYFIQFGSTTNFGGGGTNDNYTFSVPVTAAAATPIVGSGWGHQSDGARTILAPRMLTTSVFVLETVAGRVDNTIPNGGPIDAISPWTWANGNQIYGVLHYEKA